MKYFRRSCLDQHPIVDPKCRSTILATQHRERYSIFPLESLLKNLPYDAPTIRESKTMECANKSVAATIITRAAQVTLASFLLNTAVMASPVKYEGYLVTDISLAGVFYHNAQITIDFAGDTKDVHTLLQFPVQSDPTNTQNGGGAFIARGVASVVIVANGRRISARLGPNQIVVAVDTANGGIGFGARIGPNGFEPAYPLGLSMLALPSRLCFHGKSDLV